MNLEMEAQHFIQEMAALYFDRRALEGAGKYMAEDASRSGTDSDEQSRNLTEARQVLVRELEEYGGALRITGLQCETAEQNGSDCVVYGAVKAEADKSVRFTAVTEHTAKGIRLLHLHFSHADHLKQTDRSYVPCSVTAADNKSLRYALKQRERQLANLTKNIPGGAHQCASDSELSLLSMSDGFLSMFGYTREEIGELFQDKFINMIYPPDREEALRVMTQQLQNGPDIELEYRVFHKGGQLVWVLDKGRLLETTDGRKCFYCVLVEINDRKREQEELRLSLERHQLIMDQATDIIFDWDIRRDTLHFSHNWRKKFGYDAVSREISDRIPLSQNIHPEDIPAFVKIMRDTASGVPYSETEFRIRNVEGDYLWCRIRATTQYDENKAPIKAVGVIVDIDREKRRTQELLEQAQIDALTGLYNKATVNALVEQQMSEKGFRGMQALLIIDVDYFKAVNDTYGHLCGDGVLSDVAAVLKAHIHSADVAGRIGGDEFLIYLPEVEGEGAVRRMVEDLLTALRRLTPEVGAPPISCSIGGALFPRDSIDYLALYQCADQALYYQKSSGRGCFSLYSPELKRAIPGGEEHTAVGAIIGSDDGNARDEHMAQYAFRILYAARDIEAAMNRLLEIVGRSYGVGRVYIFESSRDGATCSNTFEWCGEGILPQKEKLQNLSYTEELDNYQQNFDSSGIFYCADARDTSPGLRAVLEPQGICSMLQCAMLDEGKFVGYVGFDECEHYRAWTASQVASFKLTADVLSTFLVKLRQRQRLQANDEGRK